ncbi:MAG: thioredoxin fold domain-containing protein [Burkholderiaceae bacterium]
MRRPLITAAITAVVTTAAFAAATFAMAASAATVVTATPSALAEQIPPAALARPAAWASLLARATARGEPVVVLFSTPGCPWCELLRRDHLQYLARDSRQYGVQVVELDITDHRPFSDGGSAAEVARTLGIRFSPTVAFVGAAGELAERLIGYTSPDFYGAYLDERIKTARAVLAVPR